MTSHLRVADDLQRFEPEPGVLVLVRPKSLPITLLGSEWRELIDAIDGGLSEADLESFFSERIPPARVRIMIAHLRSHQALLDVDQRLTPYGVFVGPQDEVTVELAAFGRVDLEPVRMILESGGVGCDLAASLHLVIVDNYANAELEAFNNARIADGQPWLLASPYCSDTRIGPLFLPGRGPCWRCLEARQRPREQVRNYLGRAAEVGKGWLPIYTPAVTALFPIIERFVTKGRDPLFHDHIRTFDLKLGTLDDHRLIRRPQCPDCGDPSFSTPRSIGVLSDDRPVVSQDGGERQIDPVLSFEAMSHHISPVTGIADAIVEAHVDSNILCYGVMRPSPEVVGSVRDLIRAALPTGLGWGKGWSHAQARMSALGEAIERFTMSDERPPDHIRAPFNALGDAAVDPREVLLFSDAQYKLAGTGEGHDRIPESRFDPDMPIGWTVAKSLTTGAERLIASDQMWLTPMTTRDANFCIADSNGCAAGNTLEESILQGILELVERDAVAIWWFNRLRAPLVDLPSFGESFERLRQHYASAHDRHVWALDLTVDLGIPVFAAVSAVRNAERPEYVACFGSHLDPHIALQRAMTELGLMMAGWKDFFSSSPTPRLMPPTVKRWLGDVGVQNQLQMRPSDAPPRHRGHYNGLATGGCLSDIRKCIDLIDRAGIEIVVADATRHDIGLHVVRVVAPGLRHFRPRFAPGRLYNVPVALGSLDRPLCEAELNPFTLPF